MTQRCTMDGFTFSGEPTLLPTSFNRDQETFVYENSVFCSPSCAKGWLFRDVHINTDRIQLFTIYCRKVLGLCEPIHICPNPQFIREYMLDPEKGITIDTFRAANTTCLLATGFKHVSPSVDKTVYLEEIKTDVDGIDDTYTV